MFKLFDAAWKSVLAGGLALAMTAPVERAWAAQFELLHTFRGGSDGEYPEAGLTTDSSGTLYGTTFGTLAKGTRSKPCSRSCGTVYDVLNRNVNSEYSFQAGPDGAFPTGELFVQSGNIYGTTEYGGETACGGLGCGTAFVLPVGGTADSPFQFCTSDFPNCVRGALPHAGPIVDSNGIAYGTTTLGGTGDGSLCDSNFNGCGVVYSLTPELKEKVLYNFCSEPKCADGAVPLGRLLMDTAGDLFGTTQFGGKFSQGTVFELKFANNTYSYTVLYSFCKEPQVFCPDGSVPEAGLIADSQGNLYGTATFGGGQQYCNDDPNLPGGCGVIFELTPKGDGTYRYHVLYAFLGGNDGMLPEAPLVMDDNGNLYGTTLKGGGGSYCAQERSCGTVFELQPGATADSILHAFGSRQNASDGAQPEGALLWQSPYLYGATRIKGSSTCGCGTLYRISLP